MASPNRVDRDCRTRTRRLYNLPTNKVRSYFLVYLHLYASRIPVWGIAGLGSCGAKLLVQHLMGWRLVTPVCCKPRKPAHFAFVGGKRFLLLCRTVCRTDMSVGMILHLTLAGWKEVRYNRQTVV